MNNFHSIGLDFGNWCPHCPQPQCCNLTDTLGPEHPIVAGVNFRIVLKAGSNLYDLVSWEHSAQHSTWFRATMVNGVLYSMQCTKDCNWVTLATTSYIASIIFGSFDRLSVRSPTIVQRSIQWCVQAENRTMNTCGYMRKYCVLLFLWSSTIPLQYPVPGMIAHSGPEP